MRKMKFGTVVAHFPNICFLRLTSIHSHTAREGISHKSVTESVEIFYSEILNSSSVIVKSKKKTKNQDYQGQEKKPGLPSSYNIWKKYQELHYLRRKKSIYIVVHTFFISFSTISILHKIIINKHKQLPKQIIYPICRLKTNYLA